MKKTAVSMMIILALCFAGVECHAEYKLPDTGQTRCYNDTAEITPCPTPGQDYYGQDGCYTINPPSYTKSDATGNALPDSATSWAMIKDNNTGLIWENKTTDGSIHDANKTYTWDDAQNIFIPQLKAATGLNDWRMPTTEELRSIADYSKSYPAINTQYFPNTQSSYYWSSSTYAISTRDAWLVYFSSCNGNPGYKSDSYYVRAVRGGQSGSSANLVINNDGTVTDTTTGLMWQRETGNNGVAMTWKAALAYCQSLNLNDGYAGHTDWRLPNIRELASLVDLSRYNPAIDPKFSDTKSSGYWSSSTYAYSTSYAWSVGFSYGNVNYASKSDSYYVYYVRAVRGGQSGSFDYSGDLNHQNGVDLADAILALKVVSGLNPSGIFFDADVNSDGKIGLAEVVYILQTVAGLRS